MFTASRSLTARRSRLAAALGAVVGLSLPSAARADVSSWLFVGSGPSWVHDRQSGTTLQPALQLDTGMGTDPSHAVIVGGVLRWQTHFGRGTDLGLVLRTATGGFVNGDWGGAIDLGGYERWWGVGSSGGTAALVLGAPWGVTLTLGGALGSNEGRGMTAVLGVDLARLTIYRRSGSAYWQNSFPAYRPEERR